MKIDLTKLTKLATLKKIAGIAITGILAITITALIIAGPLRTATPGGESSDAVSEPGYNLDIPSAVSEGADTDMANSKELDGDSILQLDLDDRPAAKPTDPAIPADFVEDTDGSVSSTGQSQPAEPSPTATAQKPPSAAVTVVPDSPVPKDTTPVPENPEDRQTADGWTPPPPGEGTGDLIWEGAENIPIDGSAAVEALHRELGFYVGNGLIEAGYTSIYPNASPRDLVEDAARVYARTGNIVLNPASYGLPKVVGYFAVRLPATGSNVVDAGNTIIEYMKSDAVFNQKVQTVFSVTKDGWLSVYQKDGYFFILFVVVDIGYDSFG
ncbi:MAG: hypothetical protein ACYCYM_09725 [Saccharofermentanales bacterium]